MTKGNTQILQINDKHTAHFDNTFTTFLKTQFTTPFLHSQGTSQDLNTLPEQPYVSFVGTKSPYYTHFSPKYHFFSNCHFTPQSIIPKSYHFSHMCPKIAKFGHLCHPKIAILFVSMDILRDFCVSLEKRGCRAKRVEARTNHFSEYSQNNPNLIYFENFLTRLPIFKYLYGHCFILHSFHFIFNAFFNFSTCFFGNLVKFGI